MTDSELIVLALRTLADIRLVDLMIQNGMTGVEGNQIRRDAEELADRLEAAA